MTGQTSYHAGLSAESIAENHYLRAGFKLAGKRWRGKRGEIDLIFRNDEMLVFVEVKKSRSIDRAIERLEPRQMERIFGTAEEFLGGEPNGQLTNSRFDLAAVDGSGRLQIIENAFGQ